MSSPRSSGSKFSYWQPVCKQESAKVAKAMYDTNLQHRTTHNAKNHRERQNRTDCDSRKPTTGGWFFCWKLHPRGSDNQSHPASYNGADMRVQLIRSLIAAKRFNMDLNLTHPVLRQEQWWRSSMQWADPWAAFPNCQECCEEYWFCKNYSLLPASVKRSYSFAWSPWMIELVWVVLWLSRHRGTEPKYLLSLSASSRLLGLLCTKSV